MEKSVLQQTYRVLTPSNPTPTLEINIINIVSQGTLQT